VALLGLIVGLDDPSIPRYDAKRRGNLLVIAPFLEAVPKS